MSEMRLYCGCRKLRVEPGVPSKATKLKTQTPLGVLLPAKGYRIQPRQPVAIGGLKRQATLVATHLLPRGWMSRDVDVQDAP